MSLPGRPTGESVIGSQYPSGAPVVSSPAGRATLPELLTSKSDMKCVVLNSFGSAKNVKILLKDRPTPKPQEVLIKARACGINFQDIMTLRGVGDNPPETPFIMGSEVGGEIVQCGIAANKFLPGDRVIAFPEFKAWAEYVAVPERLCFKLPDSIDFKDGVAFAVDGIIAYSVLFELGNLKPGKTILVESAAGGVGQVICQMAKRIPGVTVVGIASRQKEENLRSSVDFFIERGTDYVQEIKRVCPNGIDIVLDGVCGDEFSKIYSLLKPMGRYVLYGKQNILSKEISSLFGSPTEGWEVQKINPLKMYDDKCITTGSFNFRRILHNHWNDDYLDDVFSKVCEMYQRKEIVPVVDSTYCFEDIPEALTRIMDHSNIGKIMLDPEMNPESEEAALARGLSQKATLRPQQATPSEEKVIEKKSEGVGFIQALKETLMPGSARND